MTKYVRLCKTTNTKGDIIPLTGSSDIEKRVKVAPNSDWYTSLFHYEKEAYDYFKNNKSINGFTGKATLDELVFDLDCKADVEKARADGVALLKLFHKEGVNVNKNVRVYFSGGKGFHIHVSLGKEFTNDQIKTICTNIAKGLISFDSVVYNTTRLFRVPNTKHNKSGLFKIPLTASEIQKKSVDEIKKLAKNPRNLTIASIAVSSLDFMDKYLEKKVETRPQSVVVSGEDSEGIRGLRDIKFKDCPNAMPRCVYALSHGVMESGVGERSQIFLRMAAYYKNQGMTKEAAYGALKGIARDNAKLYPEHEAFKPDEIWNTVIQSVYGKFTKWQTKPGTTGINADNETFQKYCEAVNHLTDVPCSLHHRNAKPDTTTTISGIENSFDNFATNFENNTVKTGIKLIDDNMKIAVGTTTLLCGATGSGKTTLALNIMETVNDGGQYTMFFSLDMNKNLVYLKLAQKLTRYTQEEILRFYKNQNKPRIDEIKKAIANKYKNTFFDFSATLTIEEMRDKVLQIEEKNNCKVKLVLVDYASRVSGQYSDTYANAKYNALKSTEIATDTDAAWVWISQVSRISGNGATPLRTKRVAKDSSDWEESSTNLITMWRPFMGSPDEDDVCRLFLAKNRLGVEKEEVLHWDGAKGVIKDMTSRELLDYKQERQDLETVKTTKGGWS